MIERSGVQRTVELYVDQELWVERLMARRPDLTFADVVRYCVGFAIERDTFDAEAAATVIPGLRPV